MSLTLEARAALAAAPTTAPAGETPELQAGGERDPLFEALVQEMVRAPGAAVDLLTAFAAQTRALRLVLDADARGAASLPPEVRHRLARAMDRTPTWLGAS